MNATFTATSKVGRVLGNAAATEVLFAALPELADSPHTPLLRGLSLQALAEMVDRDQTWVDELVGALTALPTLPERDLAVVPRQDYEDEGAPLGSAPWTAATATPRWGVHEIALAGPSHGNPFTDVELSATFTHGDETVTAHGFYDGEDRYCVRFMPDKEGVWSFRTYCNARSLDGIEGTFTCEPPEAGSHGPVRVSGNFHFAHADGTSYRPIGTTCYAWTHQSEELELQTLDTLAESPFNKIRMCVFPKAYLYNDNEPERHAFKRLDDGTFDLTRFDPEFFRHLEERVADLGRLGIEADIILFHPYDRWGYADLPAATDDRYLRYVVARLSAYANVWWSLANEFDLMWDKEEADWERFGTLVQARDPHSHLLSVHNCREHYDHTKPWVTHCSVQRVDNYRTAENTTEWREQWGKPVVIDECAYEGDIDMVWGNISGEEMTRRSWEGAVRGGYVGHGETYLDPDDVLWWSKGGELHGTSPARIAFLRWILEDGPAALEPDVAISRWGYPTAGVPGEYYLQYLGFFQPRQRSFELPPEHVFRVEIIDTWNMTIEDGGVQRGGWVVDLPGRPYIAIRITRAEHE